MDSTASFGYWVRRRRKALDLTQDALARQVGCAAITIRKIEADELRPSAQVAERLADSLQIEPETRTSFIKAARADLAVDRLALPTQPVEAAHSHEVVESDRPTLLTLPRTIDWSPPNLPVQPTVLIGREPETAEVCALVRRPDVRLVTLTGPGGTGKTRLALQAAAKLNDDFHDGVWFVDLAPIRDAALVATTIAQILGMREGGDQTLLEGLKAYLRARRVLLLLDNFEQVVDAAPLVADLLAAAPDLKVLVTSRMPLHLSGEREYAVPPLALPDRAHPPALERLTQYGAVRLFIERAQAVKANFIVTNENATATVEICHRLDGLPLAIELAAARTKLFQPHALLARLDQRLKLLIGGARDLPPRQQTMRSTIDWSYTLLHRGEQILFARLGIFVGGCTLEALEAVCNRNDDMPIEVVEGVGALLDQSLLRQEPGVDGEPRLALLETIREYALERLAASGETALLRRRHAEYYLALAETAEPMFRSAEWLQWRARLAAEQDNLRAALAWSDEAGAAELGLRLVGALLPFWESVGYFSEGRHWALKMLACSQAEGSALPSPTVRARALLAAGLGSACQMDFGAAQQSFEQSVALARSVGDTRVLAEALTRLASTVVAGTDVGQDDLSLSDARSMLEESIRLLGSLGDDWSLPSALYQLGRIAARQGDLARQRTYLEEGLRVSRALGHNVAIADGLTELGYAASTSGDLAQAWACFTESLALRRALGEPNAIVGALIALGWGAWMRGDVDAVEKLFTEGIVFSRRLDLTWFIIWGLNHLGWVAWARGEVALAAERYDESLALSRELRIKNGIAWGLHGLGLVSSSQGEMARAKNLFAESLALFREGYIVFDVAFALNSLGRATLALGDAAGVAALFQESITLARNQNDTWNIAAALEGFADVARIQEHAARAARLFGCAEALRELMEAPLWPPYRAGYEQAVAAIHTQLDESTFASIWAGGRAMPLDQVVAEALNR